MDPALITTALEIPGYRIERNLGLVRGISVRSRSIFGNFLGGLQTLFGGNITIYADLCESVRQHAFQIMCLRAEKLGANAIISMRYDATEILAGVSEVLCYGTAVIVRRESE